MGETKPQHTGRFSPGCFFISSSLHVRKRIRGFCLPCVSVWLLRGPWCQLRWWAQGIWRHKTCSSADKAAETQAKGAGDNEAGNCNRTFTAGGRHVNAPKLVAIQIKGGDGTLFWLKSIFFWILTGHQDYLCMWSHHKRCYLLTTTWVGNHKSIWPLHPGFVKRTIWFLLLKAFRLLKCGNVNALTGENTTTKNHRNQVVTQYTLMCTTTNGPSPISLQWLYDDAKGKITTKDEDCGLPSKTAFCHFVQCWNIVQLRLTRNFKQIA